MTNYGKELRIGTDIRRKEKVEKVMEFAKRMKKVQKETGVVLRKVQKEMKQQVYRGREEVEEWKKRIK